MRTIIALGGCIATFTLISCDRQLQAPDLDPSFGIQQDKDYCQTDPECGGGTNGLIHDQSSSGTLVEPPYDPSPGANGIWLGNTVTGNVCYKNYNASIIDNDGDWLDDNCEYQLAKAFAPSVNMYAYEACPYESLIGPQSTSMTCWAEDGESSFESPICRPIMKIAA